QREKDPKCYLHDVRYRYRWKDGDRTNGLNCGKHLIAKTYNLAGTFPKDAGHGGNSYSEEIRICNVAWSLKLLVAKAKFSKRRAGFIESPVRIVYKCITHAIEFQYGLPHRV